MAYEFKRLSDVEVVTEPTESANVLIEENGVIKKAPKTAVGGAGGGGEEPDMVITVEGGSNRTVTSVTYDITEGSVDNVFNAVREGRYPVVIIRYHSGANDDYMPGREEYRAQAALYGENLWLKTITTPTTDSPSIYLHCWYMSPEGIINTDSVYRITMTAI